MLFFVSIIRRGEMPTDEVDLTVWEKIGEGKYNTVYKSINLQALVSGSPYQGPWALKIPKANKKYISFNKTSRAVRLMQEMYPDMPVARFGKTGWVMPYVSHMQTLNDEENALAVWKVYQSSGRLILDGCGTGNFLKNKKEDVICVDVDMAMRRHASDLDFFESIIARGEGDSVTVDVDKALRRQTSDFTLSLGELAEQGFDRYWKGCVTKPLTASVIKTLLCLDLFLLKNPILKNALAFRHIKLLALCREKSFPLTETLFSLIQEVVEKGEYDSLVEMIEYLGVKKIGVDDTWIEALHHLLSVEYCFSVMMIKEMMNLVQAGYSPIYSAKEGIAALLVGKRLSELKEKSSHLFQHGCVQKIKAINDGIAAIAANESVYDALYNKGSKLNEAMKASVTKQHFPFFHHEKTECLPPNIDDHTTHEKKLSSGTLV